MAKQLDIFNQQQKESYKAYYKRFYASNLKEAEERKKRGANPEPTIMISINPNTLGKEMHFNSKLELTIKD